MSSYCTATYRIYDEKGDFQRKAQSIAVGKTVVHGRNSLGPDRMKCAST